jgi:hypothetical protein
MPIRISPQAKVLPANTLRFYGRNTKREVLNFAPSAPTERHAHPFCELKALI